MFYSYLGPITTIILGSDLLLQILLLVVGLVGVFAALFGGYLTDKVGSRRARLAVLGGHVIALGFITMLAFAGTTPWVFVGSVAIWAVFAWALNPPMQASTILAAPEAAMTAVSLNIAGLYFGMATAGALGGFLLDHVGTASIPVVGVVFLVLAFLIAAPRIASPEPL